jgi:UDP-N-acetylmuramoyl-tripeptide--D-alanyl-D-alanine ligase
MFKTFIRNKLEDYVKKYFKAHPEVKLVVVAGSVGKTSTKVAIATVLSEKFRIRMHNGNHNTHLSAPLAILGIEYPEDIRGLGAWLKVFSAAKDRIKAPADVDVIIQELGTDRIGEISHFGEYLRPDIGVVTAVSPEHMEFFKTLDNVAREELAVADFSRLVLINRDDIDGKYADILTNPNIDTYGINGNAEYRLVNENFTIDRGYKSKFYAPELQEPVSVRIKLLGDHVLRPAIAAGAVALKLGLTAKELALGLSKINAVSGRMNVLKGFNKSILIDDTYNSSPLAAVCALQTLYSLDAPQRIAVLGSMNELGDSSAAEHKALGELCNPAELAWLVTVGEDANNYIASVAKSKGCKVKICNNALEAGAFVHSIIEPGAVVLLKGSQGGIFLEEATKLLLHSSDDEQQLVRQSSHWMDVKKKFFGES